MRRLTNKACIICKMMFYCSPLQKRECCSMVCRKIHNASGRSRMNGEYVQCLICQAVFYHSKWDENRKYCSANCANRSMVGKKGADCRAWKGGRTVQSNGYVTIYKPEHPRAGKDTHVFEHIVVAETKIGRRLKPSERVHHINHVKSDNRPENLEVLSDFQHRSIHMKERHKEQRLIRINGRLAWIPR